MDMSDLQQQIFLSAEMFDRRRRENNQDQDGSEDFDAKTSMEKFLDHVMKPSQVVFSASALEKTIGARLAGYHETVASGLVECGLALWDVFLQHCMKLISSGSYKGVLFVRQRFYDETPLRLRHSGGVDSRSSPKCCNLNSASVSFCKMYVAKNLYVLQVLSLLGCKPFSNAGQLIF
jgi:hypothetical protein